MPYSKKQADVMLHADARWNILCGAVRSGKTFVSFDLLLKRLEELPEGDRVMIGRTRQTLERNVLNPLRRRLGGDYVTEVNGKSTVYIAGKPFYVLGADNKDAASKIQGLGIVYAYGDEITTWHETVFQMLKSRLSDQGALFDGTCNPDTPSHWLKRGMLDRHDLHLKQWHFTIDDNPFLPREYVEELKKEYSGVFYDRYILGKWIMAEGRVYPMFEPERHVIPKRRQDYEKYWISMDYGIQNATAMCLWGLAEGVYDCIGEFYHSGRDTGKQKTDEEYYADLERLAAGLPVEAVFIDPSAASFITLVRRKERFRVKKADNKVTEGISECCTALQKGLVRFCACCERTIGEFGLYSWDPEAGKDKPLPKDDHAMDAFRYFVHSLRITRNKRQYWEGR